MSRTARDRIAFLAVLASLVQPASGTAAAAEAALEVALHVETWATVPEAGSTERCDVVLTTQQIPTRTWAAIGAIEGKTDSIEKAVMVSRCGRGPYPTEPQTRSPALVIVETTATPALEAGPMDPGPMNTFQLILEVKSRRLIGFSEEGDPIYGNTTTDRRNPRLNDAGEFILPIALEDSEAKDIEGRYAFVRIRSGLRPTGDSTGYGSFEVIDAVPGSEILLDGGFVSRTNENGFAVVANISVGEHLVGLRTKTGKLESQTINIVRGRSVVVSPDVKPTLPGNEMFVRIGDNLQGFAEFQRVRDSAVMVRVPEGEFLMGNLETEGKPLPHTVYVGAFLIDKLPVTRGKFKRYAAATGRVIPPAPYWGDDEDHPAVFVTWQEARSYCEWAGGRLPTEAEREKAARGTDGRKFPWGDSEPTRELAVFRRNWGAQGTDPVGAHPKGASPYGLLDVGGNVWEWCNDWYDPDYYKDSPRRDPTGPKTGRAHILRGGSWDSRPSVLSASCRNFAYVGYCEGDFGFRCAADLPR